MTNKNETMNEIKILLLELQNNFERISYLADYFIKTQKNNMIEDYTHEELEESQKDIDDILEAQNGQY